MYPVKVVQRERLLHEEEKRIEEFLAKVLMSSGLTVTLYILDDT